MKNFFKILVVSALGGVLTLGGYILFFENQETVDRSMRSSMPVSIPAIYENVKAEAAERTDFTAIAEKSIHAVVHVKNLSTAPSRSNPLLEFFYGQSGGSERQVVGSGSGVIISSDGYIITNYHVIQGAKKLEVTLNNKESYQAEVVGIDESTDIALLKIEKSDLPYLAFGDSDNLNVGEWVLAVGNPFNLTSTVTAGIVSAKARDINIMNNNKRIESFIQTDAAVNPGNSGGALVNTRGNLIGINTAISSQTGSYIGYSFAVPSNIARRVIEDILEFGNVQRAYLGINYEELNSEKAEEFGVSSTEGVIVTRVLQGSASDEAGIQVGDIIVKMDNIKISNFSDLQGFLGSKRPGDEVQVTVLRNESRKTFPLKLKNQFNKYKFDNSDFSKYFIGELQPISRGAASKFELDHGVEITNLRNKEIEEMYGVGNGDIILAVEDQKVSSAEEVDLLLKKYQSKDYFELQILTRSGKMGYIRVRSN
ncbi:Do family serine endopeptidase [Lutimonas saemankumensis]|uniref:S1C family serine protease n=1 Tax=Lutimonas saemankumensis TaxID=483016 RepID=UPI001CD53A7D|nr:Do family serine endopeptidase [Lutimonas saemankumensis]MCA0932317.1 Do family serine endopeptidase [Lutimonas saemankumensis]